MACPPQGDTNCGGDLPKNGSNSRILLDLNYVVVSEKLRKTSFTLGRIGECLNLEKSEVAAIEGGECKTRFDRIHMALKTWRDKHYPEIATWEDLMKALDTLGDKDLLSSINSYIAQCTPTSLGRIVTELQGQERGPQINGEQLHEQESPTHIASRQFIQANDAPSTDNGTTSEIYGKCTEESSYQDLLAALIVGRSLPRRDTLSSIDEKINPAVEEKMGALEKRFASLTTKLYKELKILSVSHEEFTVYVSTLSMSMSEKMPLVDQHLSDVISATSPMQVFVLFSRMKVWDFLNFDVLEATVNEFGRNELKTQVQAYREEIGTFKNETKLADFLRIWAGRNPLASLPDCKPIIAKLDVKMPHYTLAQVHHLEKYLADLSGLKNYIFRLSNGMEGCVILMWLVPSAAADVMKTALKDRKLDLALVNIQGLWINGELVFKALPFRTLYNKEHQIQVNKSALLWGELASVFLKWKEPFKQVMQKDKMKWFTGGKLNVTENCLDRHVEVDPERVAIIWEKDEPGCHVNVTYRELLKMTCQIANLLKRIGVRKGDVVLIYMPAMPHAVASMLACARIGAVHCVIFSAFETEEMKRKMIDTKATIVITANERLMEGKSSPLKEKVDQALRYCTTTTVRKVLVASRTTAIVPMTPGRDIALEKAMAEQPTECPSEPMDGGDNLFIMYTSGTTNKSKVIWHTQAGYLLYAAATHKLVFDYQPGDIFACVADLGWITGHSYVVYGPLCNGATTVLFESTATYPDCGRYWEMVQRLKVNQFYTIPSVLKHLMKSGNDQVTKYNLSSLKTLASVGEPLNPVVRKWYYEDVGKKRCTVIDTWWQTEIGGIAITHEYSPACNRDEPTFQVKQFFDVEPALVDKETLKEVHDSSQGLLVLKKPLPGMGKEFKEESKEFVDVFYSENTEHYNTGDMAQRGANGSYAVTGRGEDAIRIKGVWLKTPKLPTKSRKTSRSDYSARYEQSIKDPDTFWGQMARDFLVWDTPFDKVMDCNIEEGIIRWFTGGKLNVSVNCLDRHVKEDPERVAIIWEKDEPGHHVNVSYRELLDDTCRIANVLKRNGTKKGDVVIIYMSATPLAVASMLACARIGAVHCVVCAAIGDVDVEKLRERIRSANAKAVITATSAPMGRKVMPLMTKVNAAISGTTGVEFVLVASRTPEEIIPSTSIASRVHCIPLKEAMENEFPTCPPEPMDSEDRLFIIFTSGTSGKPKSITHTQAGYLLNAAVAHKQYVCNYKPGDVYAFIADLSWLPGHSCVVYGPLCNGATTVLFESTATYPDYGRYWEMVERLKISQFFTTSSVIHSLMNAGDDYVRKHDLSSLKTIGTTAEPLDTNAWRWYYEVVGQKRCVPLDVWGQTEIGGVGLTTCLTDEHETKPDCAMKPLYGVLPVLFNKEGKEIQHSNMTTVTGCLCLKLPLPGMGREVNGNPKEMKEAYFTEYPGLYCTYDQAYRDNDGDYQICGRLDDAIRIKAAWVNVPEIECFLEMSHPRVVDASLVGYKQKESQPVDFTTCAFLELREGVPEKEIVDVIKTVKEAIQSRKAISKTAVVPEYLYVVSKQPKTKSGKTVRHPLRFAAQILVEGTFIKDALYSSEEKVITVGNSEYKKTLITLETPCIVVSRYEIVA